MYLPGQHPEPLDALIGQLNEAARLCLEKLASNDRLQLMPGVDCFDVLPAGRIALVLRGQLDLSMHGRIIMVLQPGDVVSASAVLGASPLMANNDEPVELGILDPLSLTAEGQQRLDAVLLHSLTVLTYALAITSRGSLRPHAGFGRFKSGEAILQQGEEGDHVLTLMRGNAHVLVDGTRVGTVLEGEIFGALAPLTGEKRNASVVASTDCTVMMIPGEQFIELIRAQPETCFKLLQMMARQISELNRKVARRLALVT